MRLPWQREPGGAEAPVRRVLAEAGAPEPDWLAPTGTRVDVGHWLTRGRLWVAGAGDEVILAAAGERPYVERASRSELGNSFYNAVTGEAVLLPAPGLRRRRVRLAPVEGFELVERIRNGVQSHA